MITTRFCDMPHSIHSFVKHNADDSYTIVINSRLAWEEQCACFRHEMEHINRCDFYAQKCADEIELERHKEE